MTRSVAVMFSYKVEDQKGRPKWKTYALQHKPHASSSRCAHYLRPTVSSVSNGPDKTLVNLSRLTQSRYGLMLVLFSINRRIPQVPLI